MNESGACLTESKNKAIPADRLLLGLRHVIPEACQRKGHPALQLPPATLGRILGI